MRVRVAAPLASLLLGLAAVLAPASPAVQHVAAATQPKVAIIVGATGTTTATYIKYADAEYAAALKYTSNVVKVYSPNATWANVQAAVTGATIVIYHGHGNGWPSPYPYDPYYTTKDGFGLNSAAGQGDSDLKYYGEPSIRSLRFARNALVLLGNLCYASGDSEPGNPQPTLAVAKQRADNYASAFIQAGANAVIADGTHGLVPYIDALFTSAKSTPTQTIDQLWKATNSQGHLLSYVSARSPGMNARLDPDDVTNGVYSNYYRSIVGNLATTTGSIVNATPATAAATATNGFTPLGPTRVLDTVKGVGLAGAFTSGTPRTLKLAGVGGVPSDALAVAVNVTVASGSSGGFVTLAPTVTASPTTSTLNFPTDDTRGNGAIVPLATDGTIGIVYKGTAGSAVDLFLDVSGYFRSGSGGGFTTLAPTRVLDTRSNLGLAGPFTSGKPRSLQVAGTGPVPAGAIAVAVNVTAPSNATGGAFALGPTVSATPATSVVSFPGGDNRAAAAIIPLASNGTVAGVYSGPSGATANLVLDVTGYFAAGSGAGFTPVTPVRLLDTRSAISIGGAYRNASPGALRVAGMGNLPATLVAVAANVTVPANGASGYVTVGPTVTSTPTTSTLNFPSNDNRANGSLLPLAADGTVAAVFKGASGTTANIVLDVTGYFR